SAALEAQPEGRRLRALFARTQVADAPLRHLVQEHDKLAVVGREEEPLPAPPHAFEAPALERRERRVEGLQRRHVRGPGLLDRKRGHGLVQRPSERLYLRKFWHLRSQSWLSRSA